METRTAKVKFTDKGHLYYIDNKKAISVSAYVGSFKEEFRAEEIAGNIVLREQLPELYVKSSEKHKGNPYEIIKELKGEIENFDEEVKSVIKSWSEKTQKGTDLHNEKESQYLEQGYKISPFDNKKYLIPDCVYKKNERKDCDNAPPMSDLGELPEGYYPELLIYDKFQNLCGQADEVYIKNTPVGKVFDIDDYKTDGSIRTRPYYDKRFKRFPTFKFPLDHIQDSNLFYYGLKISVYSRMLSKFGLKRNKQAITHVNLKTGKEKRYPLPYYGNEVKLMEKYFEK